MFSRKRGHGQNFRSEINCEWSLRKKRLSGIVAALWSRSHRTLIVGTSVVCSPAHVFLEWEELPHVYVCSRRTAQSSVRPLQCQKLVRTRRKFRLIYAVRAPKVRARKEAFSSHQSPAPEATRHPSTVHFLSRAWKVNTFQGVSLHASPFLALRGGMFDSRRLFFWCAVGVRSPPSSQKSGDRKLFLSFRRKYGMFLVNF